MSERRVGSETSPSRNHAWGSRPEACEYARWLDEGGSAALPEVYSPSGSPEAATDGQLFNSVGALVNALHLGALDLEITVVAGVVTLSGEVASSADRLRLEQVAGSVPGVVGVENNLRCGRRASTAPAIGPAGRLTAQASLFI